MVLTHMLREVRPDIPVLFLDTFHHFPQTLAYRDELTERWGLNLINLRAATPSVGLWQAESTEACCKRHKVEPLFSGARGLRHLVHGAAPRSVAVTGQSQGRRAVQAAERESDRTRRADRRLDGKGCVGVREAAQIPLLPLYELGFTSIGCEPCTELPPDPDNPRSGRWQGQKLECGIHIQAK